MSLIRRIRSLEYVHGHALHACRTCGGHDPTDMGLCITGHERPLESCRECGLHLNEDGRPLPPTYKRIILSADAPEDVP